jgi:hypothetical protein
VILPPLVFPGSGNPTETAYIGPLEGRGLSDTSKHIRLGLKSLFISNVLAFHFKLFSQVETFSNVLCNAPMGRLLSCFHDTLFSSYKNE